MKKYVSAAVNEDDFYDNFDELDYKDKMDFAYTYLTEYEIATENEINLVTSINGYNYETLCDILYVRTAYRDFDQLEEEGGLEIAEMLGLNL